MAMARRCTVLLATFTAGCLLLGGCGGDEPEVDAGGSPSGTTLDQGSGPFTTVGEAISSATVTDEGAIVEFRPVLAVSGPPSDPMACDGEPTGIPRIGGGVELVQCEQGEAVATYLLGPGGIGGHPFESVSVDIANGDHPVISPTFREGPDGIDGFNAIAAECYTKAAVCPTGQLALVIDTVDLVTAPTIQSPSFARDQIQISGSFTLADANELVARIAGS